MRAPDHSGVTDGGLIKSRKTDAVVRSFPHPHIVMSLLWTVLAAFVIGAMIGVIRYWSAMKNEWNVSRETMSRESAERILADRKRVLTNIEPPRRVEIGQFAFRGYAFYETNQAALEGSGFTMLGDFGLNEAEWTRPGFRTFVRVGHSDDHETVCHIVDATPHLIGMSGFMKARFYLSGLVKQNLKGVSLRTELSDGRFVITATDADFVKEELPPSILRATLPAATPASELLKRHRARVMSAIGQTVAIPVTVESVGEFGRSFVRYQETMRDWRDEIGFAFTKDEETEFVATGSPLDARMSRSMFSAMRTLEADKGR